MPLRNDSGNQPARPAKTCEKCGRPRHDVRRDRFTRLDLCNPCWFSTDPDTCQRDRDPR